MSLWLPLVIPPGNTETIYPGFFPRFSPGFLYIYSKRACSGFPGGSPWDSSQGISLYIVSGISLVFFFRNSISDFSRNSCWEFFWSACYIPYTVIQGNIDLSSFPRIFSGISLGMLCGIFFWRLQ